MDFVEKVEFDSLEIRALLKIYVVSGSICPLFYFIKQQ